MADKITSDSGSNTSAAKSLNEQNWPGLLAITGLNLIAFAVVIGAIGPDPVQFSKLAAAWAVLLPAGVGLAMIRVINGLIKGKNKNRLVYWGLIHPLQKWKYPLPGSQAYTVHAKSDDRFTYDEVLDKLRLGLKGKTETDKEKELNEFMGSPKSQNDHWYNEVYSPIQDKPAVRQAERNYLFTRDYAAISFVMLFALGATGYAVINSTATSILYCVGLALQYLLVRHAAQNYGIDTVTNALAVWRQKHEAPESPIHGTEQAEALIAVLEFSDREPQ